MKIIKSGRVRRPISNRSVLFAAVLLVTAVCSWGAGGVAAAASNASCPVRILVITNSTGAVAANGIAVLQAAKVTVKSINASGGVLGCKVVATYEDDDSNATLDIGILQKAESSANYSDVLDQGYGGASIVPYTTAHKELQIQGNGSNGLGDPSNYPYYFDDNPEASWTDTSLMNLAHAKGYNKVAVITDNTSSGASDIASVTSAVNGYGGSVTAAVQVPDDIINATPAVLQAQASNPQALYVGLFGASAGEVLKAVAADGWNVPLLGAFETMNTPLTTLVPPADYKNMEGVSVAADILPGSTGIRALISQLKKSGVQVTSGVAGYEEAANAIRIFAYGAKTAKSLSVAKIAQALDRTGNKVIPGLSTGTTSYTSTSHYWRPKMGLSKVAAFQPNNGLAPPA